MCGHEAGDENNNTDAKRAPANPEKLIEVSLNDACSIGKISVKGAAQFACGIVLSDTVGKMNEDSDRLICGQFASPTHDKIFGLAVEISLPKWKGVKRMKELRDLIDAEFDGALYGPGRHFCH
jgi:hypothetical protein